MLKVTCHVRDPRIYFLADIPPTSCFGPPFGRKKINNLHGSPKVTQVTLEEEEELLRRSQKVWVEQGWCFWERGPPTRPGLEDPVLYKRAVCRIREDCSSVPFLVKVPLSAILRLVSTIFCDLGSTSERVFFLIHGQVLDMRPNGKDLFALDTTLGLARVGTQWPSASDPFTSVKIACTQAAPWMISVAVVYWSVNFLLLKSEVERQGMAAPVRAKSP